MDNLRHDILNIVSTDKITKGQMRRLQFIDAAIELLAEGSASKLTAENIAAACDVTRPLVNHYYSTMDDLLFDVMLVTRSRFQRFVVEHMATAPDPNEQLKSYIFFCYQWFQVERGYNTSWLYFYHLMAVDERFKKMHLDLATQGAKRIAAIIESGTKLGQFRKVNYLVTAKTIQKLITGGGVMYLTEGVSAEMLAEQTWRCCELLLNEPAGGRNDGISKT